MEKARRNTVMIDDDFDMEKIMLSGECFRVKRVDGGYRFVTRGESVVMLRRGDAFEIDCSPETWERVWKNYFDLGRSYRKIRESIPDDDTFMKEAAKVGAGLRVLRQDPWEMLVTFIISQRKSIPAISRSVEFIAENFGREIPGKNIFSFPEPEDILNGEREGARELMARAGIGYRLPYIFDAAERVASGALDLAALAGLSDTELVEKLKEVKGVGEKVANCVALFAYSRTSRAPVDTWIARVIATRYGGRDPFARYGENGGIMQQYAFYYAQMNKKEMSGK